MTITDVRRKRRPEFGIEPWLSLQDAEDQLRAVRPIVLHADVVVPMLPYYELLAESQGYELAARGTPLPGIVSAVFVRNDV